jgi:phenylalanyl-tRNA synthetase beta chain
MVEVGDGAPRQIVCGAPNVRAGLTVAVSLPGALLPGADKPLKKAKLRGVESNGMILSGRELELSDDHAGIMELDETLAAGTPLADVLPLSETVLEFELPANRPDLLGIWGIAREVATVTGTPLIDPDTTMPTPTGDRPAEDLLGLEVVARDLTPRYMATVLTGVTMGPSPDWMQRRLDAAGMRPINNVVDITNYVMLLTGQPLHAFDLNKLAGPRPWTGSSAP